MKMLSNKGEQQMFVRTIKEDADLKGLMSCQKKYNRVLEMKGRMIASKIKVVTHFKMKVKKRKTSVKCKVNI